MSETIFLQKATTEKRLTYVHAVTQCVIITDVVNL